MDNCISVIIPIFNVEKYLSPCINSVLNQTYTNLEIILIDDGSTDNSGTIAEKYSKKDNRIQVIHKKNGGLSDARNKGLDLCTGDYIFFIDSDDMIHSKTLETMISILKNNNADIVECKDFMFKEVEELKKISISDRIVTNDYWQASYNLKKGCSDNQVTSWGKLYKRYLFDDIRFPKGKIHEDQFTTYKLFYMAKKIITVDAQYYYYRKVNGSIMRSSYNLRRLDVIEALDECCDFYRNKNEKKLYNASYILLMETIIRHYSLITYSEYSKYSKYLVTFYRKKYSPFKGLTESSVKNSLKLFLFFFFPNTFLNKSKYIRTDNI